MYQFEEQKRRLKSLMALCDLALADWNRAAENLPYKIGIDPYRRERNTLPEYGKFQIAEKRYEAYRQELLSNREFADSLGMAQEYLLEASDSSSTG